MTRSIGDRMKENYEDRYRMKLTRRTPVIMRLDGKAFHTLTRICDRPFDIRFARAMCSVAFGLCEDVQGAKCSYVQSDEISLLLVDFDNLTTEAWFDYNVQKMVSVAAGMASVKFTSIFGQTGIFDCRVFNIPKEEVCNYFIWRQQDWIRNSIQMLARSCFSHRELQNRNSSDIHEMLHRRGVNWADLDERWKNGWFIYDVEKWEQRAAPVFSQNRGDVERHLVDETMRLVSLMEESEVELGGKMKGLV